MTIRDDDVSQLVAMGFPEEHARSALQTTNGNVERAVEGLLSDLVSPIVEDTAVPISGNVGPLVIGSTSQYTYGSRGRSACTCIALAAADFVANSLAVPNNDNNVITSGFLDRSIEEGIARYGTLQNIPGASSNDAEHMSVDEVLSNNDARASSGNGRLFDVRLNPVGGGQGVRQGALSRDVDHPLGIKCVLNGLVNDVRVDRRNGSMICILLTKSPETVLLCVPSVDSSTGAATQRKQYWLIDSHPRPQLLPGVETSYAKPHGTMDSLLQSLRDVFPFMDLGPDVPPIMSDMYNMFDMYVVEARTH